MATWNPDIDVMLTDSEDEEELKRNFKGREAMLFVVDANLFEVTERFAKALEIIRGAFISGMIANDKELMGIVFANTEMSPEPLEPNCLDNIFMPENCAVFLPPRQLTKPIVDHFLRFMITSLEDFGTQFGIAGNNGCGSFASMIRLCLNLFENCGYLLNSSKIVYMTDRNSPHAPQTHEYQRALQKAADLEGREVEFYVIPMGDEFDYEVFYKEFLSLVRDVELDGFQPTDPELLRELLTDRKLKQDFLKRCLGHFNFSLGASLQIAVQYFNYFQRRSYPRKIKLLKKDNSVVSQKRVIVVRTMDRETEEIEENEIKTTGGWYEINLGSQPIRFSMEQLNRVRNLHAPGMMLLGFKPKSSLPKNLYYKPCNFMYPDDQSVIGSKRLFRALWQRCLDREKIAICIFMRKRKSIPRYVALVPVSGATNNEESDFHAALSGDGFQILYLPMAKHIRNIDFRDWNSIENTPSSEGVEVFKGIVKKLRIKYEPSLIPDPKLEQLESNLLALALDIKTENGGAADMPNAEMQNKRIEKLLPKFQELFGVDAELAKKRPAAKMDGATAKVAKLSDDQLQSYDFVKQMIANNSLTACTVAQLRSILEEHFGVTKPKAATKAALIANICTLASDGATS